jgi:hypothetical protein
MRELLIHGRILCHTEYFVKPIAAKEYSSYWCVVVFASGLARRHGSPSTQLRNLPVNATKATAILGCGKPIAPLGFLGWASRRASGTVAATGAGGEHSHVGVVVFGSGDVIGLLGVSLPSAPTWHTPALESVQLSGIVPTRDFIHAGHDSDRR